VDHRIQLAIEADRRAPAPLVKYYLSDYAQRVCR
jgi:hypothetical protein